MANDGLDEFVHHNAHRTSAGTQSRPVPDDVAGAVEMVKRMLEPNYTIPSDDKEALAIVLAAVTDKKPVSREEMVNRVCAEERDAEDSERGTPQALRDAFRAGCERMAEALNDRGNEWRRIEDGWPTQRGFYWVTRTDGLVQKQPFDVNASPPWGFVVDVIAWMPDKTPDPYKPIQQEEEE